MYLKKIRGRDEVGLNKIGWEVQKNVRLLIEKKKKLHNTTHAHNRRTLQLRN